MEMKLPQNKAFQNEKTVPQNHSYNLKNKVREILLLLVDSEIPQINKNQVKIQIHLEQKITSPIKVKYISFSSKRIEHNNESTISSISSLDTDSKKFQPNKIALSKCNLTISSNETVKLMNIKEQKSQGLVKKGLLYLNMLSNKFRKININNNTQEKIIIGKVKSFKINLQKVPFNSINDSNNKINDKTLNLEHQRVVYKSKNKQKITNDAKLIFSGLDISNKYMHLDNLNNREENDSKNLNNIQYFQFSIPKFTCPLITSNELDDNKGYGLALPKKVRRKT